MITYSNLYSKFFSLNNLTIAYEKAKRGKSKKKSVIEFSKNLEANLLDLQRRLIEQTYLPAPLRRFIIRDPKTRTIHASAFEDRIVHHALINILEPIYENIFISDSYASRKDKGAHIALGRFDYFIRSASLNGRKINLNFRTSNNIVGYVLKSDIKHYFDNVDHEVLLGILNKKIKDDKLILLIKKILDNFEGEFKGKGMPLGNFTSQFFANVYLNELDYFVKHRLKAKRYIRYVDDFVILDRSKEVLEYYKERIEKYLECLKLKLHPDKSKINPLRDGIPFLGYRVFFHYKLLRKRNLRQFKREFSVKLEKYKNKEISKEKLLEELQGWFGYAQWANTHKLRNKIIKSIEDISVTLK